MYDRETRCAAYTQLNDDEDSGVQDQEAQDLPQDLSVHNRSRSTESNHSPASEMSSDPVAEPLPPYLPAAPHQIRVSTSTLIPSENQLFQYQRSFIFERVPAHFHFHVPFLRFVIRTTNALA